MRTFIAILLLLAANQMTLDQLNAIQHQDDKPPPQVPYNPGYNPGYNSGYNPGYTVIPVPGGGSFSPQPPSSGMPGPPVPLITTPLTPHSPWQHY